MPITKENHYNPCFWTAYWNFHYYQNKKSMQKDLIYQLGEANKKALAEILFKSAAPQQISKDEVEQILKLTKMANDVGAEIARNAANLKNTIAEFSKIRII